MLDLLKGNHNVLNIYSYGSRVYGTSTDTSDYDYIVVVKDDYPCNFLDELPKSEKQDFSIYKKTDFQEKINKHEISALECLFCPEDKIIKKTIDFNFNLDLIKLRNEISQKSSNSWVKAKKKFIIEKDYSPYIGQKSAWHSLRILDFGCQIARQGKITNFNETNFLLPIILSFKSWPEIDENMRAINKAKNTEFKKLAPKEILKLASSPSI